MPRARQYGFLRLDPRGDDYSDLYVPVEILQWFENDDEVEIRTAEGEQVTVDAVHVEHALQDHFQGCEDLLTLRDFSEPALLHTLRVRFSRFQSYTAVGTILVSVNPYSYHSYEETYGEHVMQLYRGASSKQIMASTSLPPHLFTVAERATRHAYNQIEDDAGAEKPKDQAIIISGESGAGKTEATKLIVQYLAWRSRSTYAQQERRKQNRADSSTMASSSSASGGVGGSGPRIIPVEERIVSTTPLLEALGNARTLRNDNSSRFGKFMRLFMAEDGTLIGCKIEQYLLEVTRVVKQAEGENNFHILFQLLAAKDEELDPGVAKDAKGSNGGGQSSFALSHKKGKFSSKSPYAALLADEKLSEQLDLRSSSHFHYLSRSNASPVPGLTDSKGWSSTLDCLAALNLEAQEVAAYMRLLAAVLHLGNLVISNPQTDWPKTEEEKQEKGQDVESPSSASKKKQKFNLKDVIKMGVQAKRAKEGNTEEWGKAIQTAKTRNNFKGAVRSALNERVIKQTASLVHIDHDALEDVIRCRRIVVGADQTVTAVRAPADAHAVRDAICKALYSRLWQSVIRSLNQYLDVSNDKRGLESLGLHFIGLLDFAGFEHFFEHSNGFEQLLINYANEMLQWHFNCFIFEVEIAEYAHEGIDTTEIQFRDNEPCVHFIDNPSGGIISKLDDTCLQGDKGEINNDLHREKRFIRHLFDAFGSARSDLGDMQNSKPFYFKPRHDSEFCFGVKHYAGDVVYDTRDCWADKNSDALNNDAQMLLEEQPGNPYIRRILKSGTLAVSPASALSPAVSSGDDSPHQMPSKAMPPMRRSTMHRKRSALVQRSVSRRFADSLKALISALTACYPQFVRCIKPNHHKSPDIFAGFLTFRQLVNSGMIEAINARQAGYAVRIPHAEFLFKFACLIKRARWVSEGSTTSSSASTTTSNSNNSSPRSKKLLTSQLAMMEDDPLAAAELKKRSQAFVAELTEAMHEVVNSFSTQVGNTKVFMKATFAYTLHRIAEITEDHWVRKLQRVVRKYLSQGKAVREAARRRYRALLEAANAALAASRRTRPRRRANLAAETSITGFKRRLDNLSLGPAADIYSTKLETILNAVNKKLDTMQMQCKRIKQIESGELKVDPSQASKFGFSGGALGLPGSGVALGSGGLSNTPTRQEMDAPQVLYKFTRAVERQIGEAESLSRALGDALEERRQFQSRVWEIYERFMVDEQSTEVKNGIKQIMDQVISDAEAALGTKFDEIELDGVDGDRMLDRRIAVLIAHKEITGYERDMLVRRRAVKQKLDEEEGYKVRLEALDTEYRAVLEQVELFMELCQAVSVNARSDDSTVSGRGRLNAVGTPSAELMVHMQRVHHSVETAEASLEQVMQQAEQREQQMMQQKQQQEQMQRIYGSSPSSSYMSLANRGSTFGGEQVFGESDTERYCKERITDAAQVVLREMNAVEKLGFKLDQQRVSTFCEENEEDEDEESERRRASDGDLNDHFLDPKVPSDSTPFSETTTQSLESNASKVGGNRYTPPQHRSARRKESAAAAAAALSANNSSSRKHRRSREKGRSSSSSTSGTTAATESPLTAEVLAGVQDNEDGLVVVASLDISKLSLEAQAKSLSPGISRGADSSNSSQLSSAAKKSSKSNSAPQTKQERKRQEQQQRDGEVSFEGASIGAEAKTPLTDGKSRYSNGSSAGGERRSDRSDRSEQRAQRQREKALERERQHQQEIAAAFGMELPPQESVKLAASREVSPSVKGSTNSRSVTAQASGPKGREFLQGGNMPLKRQSGGGKARTSVVYKTPFEYGLPTSSSSKTDPGVAATSASVSSSRYPVVGSRSSFPSSASPKFVGVTSSPSPSWKRPSMIGVDRRSTVNSEDSSWIIRKNSPTSNSSASSSPRNVSSVSESAGGVVAAAATWKRPSFIGTDKRSMATRTEDTNEPFREPGSPDGLSPTSIYRTASFHDRLMSQEMRRRKLDEIQAAREKAEQEKEEKEAEKGEKYSAAAAKKKAEEMAKAQFEAERRGLAPRIAPEQLAHMVEDETGYRSTKSIVPQGDEGHDGKIDSANEKMQNVTSFSPSSAQPIAASPPTIGNSDLSIAAATGKNLQRRFQRSSIDKTINSAETGFKIKVDASLALLPENKVKGNYGGTPEQNENLALVSQNMRPGTPDDLPPPSEDEDDGDEHEEVYQYGDGDGRW